jgi:hypothetical protein
MRTGAAGTGEVDDGQAMLRAARLLEQPADGGELA